MLVDGGFRVEEHFKKLPSSALNRWTSSYAPGFAYTRNYAPSLGDLITDNFIFAAAPKRSAHMEDW